MAKFVLAVLFLAAIVCTHAQSEAPRDTRGCEERCAATTCAPVRENCTRNGGAIKLENVRPGQCACCEMCAFTVRRRDRCGWTNGALYECGCNLQCKNGECKPSKGSKKSKDSSSSDSSCD